MDGWMDVFDGRDEVLGVGEAEAVVSGLIRVRQQKDKARHTGKRWVGIEKSRNVHRRLSGLGLAWEWVLRRWAWGAVRPTLWALQNPPPFPGATTSERAGALWIAVDRLCLALPGSLACPLHHVGPLSPSRLARIPESVWVAQTKGRVRFANGLVTGAQREGMAS